MSISSVGNDHNLYDVPLSGRKMGKCPTTPKRVLSLSSLTTLNEVSSNTTNASAKQQTKNTTTTTTTTSSNTKRPGDYYIQKIHSKSALNLPKNPPPPLPNATAISQQPQLQQLQLQQQTFKNNRLSQDSLMSNQSSVSDDHSSIVSSQFDTPATDTSSTFPIHNGSMTKLPFTVDTRHSSMTSTSTGAPSFMEMESKFTMPLGMTSGTNSGTPTVGKTKNSIPVNTRLQQQQQQQLQPLSNINNKSRPPPLLKAASTTNIARHVPTQPVQQQVQHQQHQPVPKTKRSYSVNTMPTLNRTTSSASTSNPLTLSRTKSKYLSSQESKERKLLRKKKYEENDDDEELLSNDLDNLIFNVPVIKNQNELYSLTKGSQSQSQIQSQLQLQNQGQGQRKLSRSGSSSSSINLSSSTILSRNDLINDHNDKYNIRPCPLPGKLGSTSSIPHYINTSINDDSILEEEDADEGSEYDDTTMTMTTDDSIIANNITEFYNQRSASVSKLIKLSREQNVLYNLPSFIKSQSSLDDLHLISPEKLNFLDQTRPINLPPKSPSDKNKHNKQFSSAIDMFQVSMQNENDSRMKIEQLKSTQSQEWINLVDSFMQLDNKQFNKKFTAEKNKIRKLAWDCNIPQTHCFKFLLKILSNNYSSQDSLNTICNSFELFDQKLKTLSPVMKQNKDHEFSKIVEKMKMQPLVKHSGVDHNEFKSKLMHLLYIKSISESGLAEKDYLMITILLCLFPHETNVDLYCLLELVQHEVLDAKFSQQKLGAGKSSTSSSVVVEETKNITLTHLLLLILKFNDCQKLSASAMHQQSQQQQQQQEKSLTPVTSPNPQNDVSAGSDTVIGASLEIVMKLITLLVVNSQSLKTREKNNLKLLKLFNKTVFVNYHLGWNSFEELTKSDGQSNEGIRVNYCADQLANLDKFIKRWCHHHFG